MAEENLFPGLTRIECPLDCSAEKCAISGVAICAHPCKGGLQSSLMREPKALQRYRAAEKMLKIDELKKQYDTSSE